MSDGNDIHKGGCECGAVRYEIKGRLRGATQCHCGQCRRTHGHAAPYTAARGERVKLTEERGLKWYRSSDTAERGFCDNCGASLFYRPLTGEAIAIAAGSLDQPSGIKLIGHIFVADKADYYEITDNLPQYPGDWAVEDG